MEKNVLAVIAGREITEEELNAFIQRLPREQQMYATNPQFREHCKEQLIAMNVLAQCGVDEKLEETEDHRRCKKRHFSTACIKEYIRCSNSFR